ncbi:MAG TPA: hypothetical protein VG274_08675, partial [Rhizomicrobium sp.]|nr:hypothetical protein [Rhizomicrobium sp.]
MTTASDEKPFTRLELALGAFYAFVIFWINLRICRDFFRNVSAPNNSMHGFWSGMARWADGAWFHPAWWPYWDGGIPFELTYAPGIPFFTSLVASARHVTQLLAFNSVTGALCILAPLTLFLMAWVLTRAPGWAFIAALVYSLSSPTQLLAPDGNFAWRAFWDARRIYLVGVWDDTPHLAAVALLPLIVLFLSLSIRRRRPIYYAAAALCIALASFCSAFGPTDTFLAAVCLVFVLRREHLVSNIAIVAGIGVYAWAMDAPFLSPAVFTAIRESSSRDGTGWSVASWTALAIVIFGWILLWIGLRRWTSDWRLRFFGLFAYLMSAIPMLGEYLNRQFLPQPGRYKLEMELAIALFAVFAIRHTAARLPVSVRVGALLIVLAFAGEQIVSDRAFAKNIVSPADPSRMIEARASLWADRNLPGVRISMPGSIAMWSNLFSPVQQFAGGAWSMAYNQVQQRANDTVQNAEDPVTPLLWLRAYGVGAICVSGPKSPEFWKAVRRPEK